jgi:hypothetical protein
LSSSSTISRGVRSSSDSSCSSAVPGKKIAICLLLLGGSL